MTTRSRPFAALAAPLAAVLLALPTSSHAQTSGTLLSACVSSTGRARFTSSTTCQSTERRVPLVTESLDVTVDCAASGTIASALMRGASAQKLRILVRGTCTENVAIARNDVTLVADTPGATIRAATPPGTTISVTGDRVRVEGLAVRGGLIGVAGNGADGLDVRGCSVTDTSLAGVAYLQGSSGTLQNSTVQNSALDGVIVDGSDVSIFSTTVSRNRRAGIQIFGNSSGRLGFRGQFAPLGNTVTENGNTGIVVAGDSTATLSGNTIRGNGVPIGDIGAAINFGNFGVSVLSASLFFSGANEISSNQGEGLFVSNGRVSSTSGLQIAGNGTATGRPGVFATGHSNLDLTGATISGNGDSGILLTLRASLDAKNITVTNNGRDGISLGGGSSALLGRPQNPNAPSITTISGNQGFGVGCADTESSLVITSVSLPGPNGLGIIDTNRCTGFSDGLPILLP